MAYYKAYLLIASNTSPSPTEVEPLRLVIRLLVAVVVPSVPLATRVLPADLTAVPNDNRTPAGTRVGDTLLIHLTVSPAAWHLLGDANSALRVAAFGEEGKAPTIPAPLIRVGVGTPIHAIIRNPLDDTLVVRGLSERGGVQDSLVVPPRDTGAVTFVVRRVGTYQYWGALRSWQRQAPLPSGIRQGWGRFRLRFDSQLAGALIVDPPGAVVNDRIFVITETIDQAPPVRTERHGIPGREFTAAPLQRGRHRAVARHQRDPPVTSHAPARVLLSRGLARGHGDRRRRDLRPRATTHGRHRRDKVRRQYIDHVGA